MTAAREDRLRRFHARYPGSTSRALRRTASYERLADRVAAFAGRGRVLDLGCGDGVLVELLARRGLEAFGIDLSLAELHAARTPAGLACARAQALPFADRAFAAVASHFAFMLFDDIDAVVAECARVLAPGGRLFAVLGGGPTATGDDAFHRFLAVARPHLARPVRFGDPRAKSPEGWRTLFAGWRDITFERDELDLSGSFDEVWQFLGASYELADTDRDKIRGLLHAAVGDLVEDHRVPCRAAIYLATATQKP